MECQPRATGESTQADERTDASAAGHAFRLAAGRDLDRFGSRTLHVLDDQFKHVTASSSVGCQLDVLRSLNM